VDYVHRIGRTGRAGEPGLAISFVSADSEAHFHLIEKRQGLALPMEEIAGFEPKEVATPIVPQVAADKGGIKGKRPSKKDKLRAQAAAQTKPPA
jgi:superfamily II DNA/RNA helicase